LCSAADVLLMMMMDVVVVGVVFDWLWWIFFQELMLGN
jgi:hypothetical protein